MRLIFSIFLVLLSLDLSAAVLELGSSKVQGKKDQPEALTFVAPAPMPEDAMDASFSGKAKIIEEAKRSEIFKLVYSN